MTLPDDQIEALLGENLTDDFAAWAADTGMTPTAAIRALVRQALDAAVRLVPYREHEAVLAAARDGEELAYAHGLDDDMSITATALDNEYVVIVTADSESYILRTTDRDGAMAAALERITAATTNRWCPTDGRPLWNEVLLPPETIDPRSWDHHAAPTTSEAETWEATYGHLPVDDRGNPIYHHEGAPI
ncbi:hypothetical protein [Stackebrandtia soli]|uniref:hypothetical protein n=1 Tax=Stackebrandtia soli TaxID=1892856 RepID=UPI0039ECBF3A